MGKFWATKEQGRSGDKDGWVKVFALAKLEEVKLYQIQKGLR